ncbi:sodium:solute symporter family transporter [Tepidamorphus sp. 3E244]|uniref:sodium:solute symporter family transporter n=1 Tax=Tepidamorphus sp. 3E244 TaxID=3385498 RepID=UPI0038FCA499
MTDTMQAYLLLGLTAAIIAASFAIAGRTRAADGFFEGTDSQGRAPGLWPLVLSQVTTWIFARSLLNAAILGFYYGIAGVLAYTAYYASFLTGWVIVDRIRFRAGSASIQDFLRERFGRTGEACFNFVIALRLLSEVFANLLVVGAIFAGLFPAIPGAENYAIVGLALVGLAYSMMGGLRASVRTDVLQMIVFLIVFAVALVALFMHESFSAGAVLTAGGVAGPVPGWVLLVVAGLQVFSYPAHDPVMTDRGFLADRATTRASFLHAFWISALCIFGFGLFGIQAGLLAADGDSMQAVWGRMFHPAILLCLNAALVVSALSTLDSALSSAARLTVRDMKIAPQTVTNGRIAMALFMLGGVGVLLADVKDLYAAVAVSGTASMFLAPVVFFSVLGGRRDIPVWSYLTAFFPAIGGAAMYFYVEAKAAWAVALFGGVHKYTALLAICIAVLVIGNAAFAIGMTTARRRAVAP